MEKKLEDSGLEKTLYMISVQSNVITEANSAPTNAAQGVENQHREMVSQKGWKQSVEKSYIIIFLFLFNGVEGATTGVFVNQFVISKP